MQQTTELVQTPAAVMPSQRLRSYGRTLIEVILPPLAFFVVLLALWEIMVDLREIPEIILPKPSAIIRRLAEEPGYFFIENGLITFYEALAGFAVATVTGIGSAALMARSRIIERTVFPLAIVIKATPIIVIAPLLVIWGGYGPAPKVIMAALLCYFPIMVNTIIGLRSVNPTSLEFFQSVAASEIEIFYRLRVPHSLPYVISAFKTSASLAVIGAVVAEWAGAGQGLGRVVFLMASYLDQEGVFAGIVVLAAMGILLTALVGWLERRLLHWHESMIVG
jgi:NitT/TauT family transport system permease protein